MKTYIHKGKDRPFIYISNFGDVYLKNGDVVTYDETYIYIDRIFNYEGYHRHTAYISNLVDVDLIGEVEYLDYFENVLKGIFKTPLEKQIEKINMLCNLVPDSDFCLVEYNFSNQFRPVYKYTFKDGLYYGSNIKSGSKKDVAWYMYHNLMIIVSKDIEEMSAQEFDVIYQSQFK